MLDERNKAICLDMISDPGNEKLQKEYMEVLGPEILIRQLDGSPFNVPDESVDGLIRFASTEQGTPIGINPEECHVLIAGQTGSGKSTLLRIIFTSALLHNQE
jgi:polynucleotide 5'-kinase involved in rRNA processing